MEILEKLKWRYATKSFDASRKVSPKDLETIMEAVRLSASSYGLQPYKVLVISDPELREKLKPASWGQRQITESSQLFVFCNRINDMDKIVDEYVQLKTDILGLDPEKLKAYSAFVKAKLNERSTSEQADWTARQTYIALGNLMIASAELGIDTCPIEGFDPNQYDEILGLAAQGLKASVVAAIGYRSPEDSSQYVPKVRKPVSDLFAIYN